MTDRPTDRPEDPTAPAAAPLARRRSRRDTPWRTSWVRTGVVLTSGFAVWLVMNATVLQHSAYTSIVGTRRSVALTILDPLSSFARVTGIDLPVASANEALGRASDGGFPQPSLPPSTTTTTYPHESTTTTTVPRLHPSHRHPLRVLLVGDSLGTDLDAPLLTDLESTGEASVCTDDVISTGLTRLDYYDWIAWLEHYVAECRPEVVIGMIGANDSQSFVDPITDFGTSAWAARYTSHVSQFFTIGTGDGRKMLWVSVPLIADTGESQSWDTVRRIQQREAGIHHVYYVDSDTTLDPGGTFHWYLRVGGALTLARYPSDGIHLEPGAAALLASAVMSDLRHDLHLTLR